MEKVDQLAKLIRYFSLISTTQAGSGHPTSSLSGADLMAVLFFNGYFKFDIKNPDNLNNDRLIFSKGHASPLFYSLWAAAGAVTEEELLTLRKFGSKLEGHPTREFEFTEVPTGSLGQGLSVGVGMALSAKLNKIGYNTFVLLGDSEMAEGSVWEALEIGSHYKLNNLIGVLDVNRLGQRGETMLGWDVNTYQERISSFGWETIIVDGHNLEEISSAYKTALGSTAKPTMVIAKTIKGKGISFLENKDGWHGKALSKEELEKALSELGTLDKNIRGELTKPPALSSNKHEVSSIEQPKYEKGSAVATRKAYGNALNRIFPAHPTMVVLDAEVSNSTYSEYFKKEHEDRFFEMFIAEQNMVSAACGMARRGDLPFVSTFATFFTRAFDQLRMTSYAKVHVVFCGSHAGVSIGEDGTSQMGLEDIALFRSLLGSTVLYPSDAVSTEKLVEEAAKSSSIIYIRTTRMDTPVLYDNSEEFKIGGSKTLKESLHDVVTIVAAGITLHEALKAYEELKKDGISVRVIDLYSIKPIDVEAIKKAATETKGIITVEDSYHEGGIGEAVLYCLDQLSGVKVPVEILAVRKMPRSGKPAELLDYEEISSTAIIKKVKELI